MIKEYDSVVRDIDNYISDNRDNWLIPHMSDITYIRSKDRSKVVGILRRESLIGKSTIHFFASPDFLNLNIRQRLSNAIMAHGFSVGDVVVSQIGSGFVIYRSQELPLFLWYFQFAQQFNYVLLSPSPLAIRRLDILLECCRVQNALGNYLGISKDYFHKAGVSLIDFSEDANEFHFRYREHIYHAPLTKIAERFLIKYIFLHQESAENLLSTLLSCDRHENYEDYQIYIEQYKKGGIEFFRL